LSMMVGSRPEVNLIRWQHQSWKLLTALVFFLNWLTSQLLT
jgi:hypothetical protein